MINSGLEQHQAARQNPILVPNSRLSEAWIGHHYRSLNPGCGIIAEPPVKILSEWAREILQEAQVLAGEEFPALINQQQQLALWKTSIAVDGEILDDNQISALAGLARSAERQLRQWHVFVPEPAVNDQFRQFLRWRARVKRFKGEHKLATAEDQMDSLVQRLVEPGFVQLPERLSLFGFLELTRSEAALLTQLALRGVKVDRLPLDGNHQAGDCTVLRYTDFDAEVSDAARWAVAALEAGAGQVAIVVNDIDHCGAELRHILEQHLHPDKIASGLDMQNADFHIPTGVPLQSQQVVADALLLLDLSLSGPKKPWPAAKISRFLLSPHFRGATEEYMARAQLELHMRKHEVFEPSLDTVRQWLQLDQFKSLAPLLSDLLSGMAHVQSKEPLAVQMTSWLKYWGWTDLASGHRLGGKCITRFLKLIENLAFLRPKNAAEALKLIKTLCRDTRICIHGGELSSIQVLSPETAIGRRFDAARVINMRQDNWPARPRQNGLIPSLCWPLLGRATVESEFEHASQVTGLLKTLAPSVLFSWTDHDNGAEIPPSALLADLGVPANSEPAGDSFWRSLFRQQGNTSQLEVRPEQPGLPLNPAENNLLPGGAGLFAEQANAPMAAYCRRRLGAEWWEMPRPFVDASYRGQVLHAALEYLYTNEIGVAAVPDNSQIPAAVDKALKKYRARQKMTAPALTAEITRLQQLLAEWLALDRLRPHFSPLSLEYRELVNWQDFSVSLRIDRIDRLPGGKLLIIDYKSGSIDTGGWADERLSNPQLPLYALLYEQHTGEAVNGICLAGVRANGCAYAGVSDDQVEAFDKMRAFGGSKSGLLRQFESWPELRAHWRQQLDVLFLEIRQGHCENRIYKDGQLQYLGLDSLLRIAEGEHWLSEHANDPAC